MKQFKKKKKVTEFVIESIFFREQKIDEGEYKRRIIIIMKYSINHNVN